jgi:multidrug resistance efflux pump
MSIVALEFSSPPATTSRVSLVSASGKRMHSRVDLPLTIGFADGRFREAADWSISGFSLGDGSFVATEGSIHRVDLLVPLADCTVTVEADAKVTRISGPYARGFRFVGLSPERARIIDHFIQSGVDGDAAVIGGLPVAHGGSGEGPPRRRGKLIRNVAQATTLLLLAAAVSGGAALVASRYLTVTADYAAVAGNLQQLHAPQAGYLVADGLAVGTRVRAGERIGAIQPIAGPQARLSTETQIAALQAGLEQQKLALEQARAGFATFLQTSRTDFVEALANRQMLETQVASENKTYGRLASLKAKDVVGQQRLDQEQQVLLNLQRSLSDARNAEETTRQKLANAEAGRFASDGRTTQKSPADLQHDVDATEATIRQLQTVLAGLDAPLPIASPCDCTVAAVAATPGSYVLSGARIADLVEDGQDGATTVDALVQNPRLNLVRQGQEVMVYLADRPDGVSGHVVNVNFNPGDSGRTGLPATLRTLDDYGLMTVRLDALNGNPPVGLPASIMAPVSWATFAASVPGLRWGQGMLERLAGRATSLVVGDDPAAAGKADRLMPSRRREPV